MYSGLLRRRTHFVTFALALTRCAGGTNLPFTEAAARVFAADHHDPRYLGSNAFVSGSLSTSRIARSPRRRSCEPSKSATLFIYVTSFVFVLQGHFDCEMSSSHDNWSYDRIHRFPRKFQCFILFFYNFIVRNKFVLKNVMHARSYDEMRSVFLHSCVIYTHMFVSHVCRWRRLR